MTEFIEVRILTAVRSLLSGAVNEFLGEAEFAVPPVELGRSDFSFDTVVPAVSISTCERTEKERIIRLDAYALHLTFELPDMPDGELCCYAYAAAVCAALAANPTLGGVADRAVLLAKKYHAPKIAHCGGWGVTLSLRVTVLMSNALKN